MLTEEKTRYRAADGRICPFCKSQATTIGPIILEDPVRRDCVCQSCHRYWSDILEMVLVDVVER